MRSTLKLIGLSAFLALASASSAAETLIVRAKKGAAAVPAESRAVRSYPEVRETVIAVPSGWAASAYAEELRATGRYEYVCLNPVVRPCRRPDDPKFPYQWHHTTMQSERAWDIRSGLGADVVVGLVDTGVDLTHPDLAPNLVSGWDMVSNKSQISGGDVQDDEGHGTAMAGLIAARGNNGQGVSGMGWGIKVMPIKVIDGATLDQILAGARKAADLGCKVVNVSYEGVNQQAVETTGQYCKGLDALLVYSAGNNGANLNFDYPSVIVVGASNQQDQLLAGSAYGDGVDVVAPGSTILSTARYGKYDYTGGTSASAAITSGVAAMMRWINPYMTWETWSNNLVRGTVDLGTEGRDSTYGWGRLDAYRATKRVVPLQAERIGKPAASFEFLVGDGLSLNSDGVICGTAFYVTGGGYYRPFVRRADGSFVELPTLGGQNGSASCINDRGTVFGSCLMPDGAGYIYVVGCRWRPPSYQLELLPVPDQVFPWHTEVRVCNNRDEAIGTTSYAVKDNGPTGSQLFRLFDLTLVLWGGSGDFQTGYPSFTALNDDGYAAAWINGNSYEIAPDGTRLPVSAPDGSNFELIQLNNNRSWLVYAKVAGTDTMFLRRFGSWLRLEGPAGYVSVFARWMNETEQVTGTYYDEDAIHGSKPALWNEKYAENPNRLLAPTPEAWEVFALGRINRYGAFTATGDSLTAGRDRLILRPLYNQGQGGLTVNCGLILGDYPGDPYKVPVTLKLYQNGVLKETIPNLVPGSNGYRFTTLLKGVFTVEVTAPHFLTRVVPNVIIEEGVVSGLDALLVNGDIDGDNVIGLFDYLALSEAFDSVSDLDGDSGTQDPSPNWNPMADLDGDETISVFDYLVLSDNFDTQGDSL